MANTLRFKRGLASGIPTGVAGEPLFTTDTFDLYIGNGTTNTRFQKYIASGASTQLLRGDGSLLTMPIVLTSPANGQVLKYNGTSWVNDSDAGITGSGAAGQVAYFTGATTQGGSNNLFWDATNNRLGLMTASPSFRVDVRSTSGGVGIHSASNTADDILFYATGTVTGNIQPFRALISATGNINQTLRNTNTATGGSQLDLIVSPLSTGDAFVSFTTLAGTMWSMGIDNSDSDKLKIGNISDPSTGTPHMTMFVGGNTALGSASDSGQRLQVTGDTLLKGSGNTSATTALRVQNSDTLQLFQVLNNGNIGMPDASLAGYTLNVGKSITGSIISAGIWQNGSVLADVTTNAIGIYNFLRIPASTAISSYQHFRAEQAAFGAGATLGTQIGFIVENSVTGATNNYGFFGNIASGTGRWNLYMNGTANNYMAGSLGIGVASPTIKLQVENNENAGNGVWARNTNSGSSATSFFTTVSNAGQANIIAHSTTHSVWANTALLNTTSGLTGGLTTFVSAGNYDVWTGSSIRQRITSGGNVIIGSTSDTGEQFQVTGTAKITGASSFGGNMTSTGQFLRINQNTDIYINAGYDTGYAGIQVASNHGLQFATNNSRRATITSIGNFILQTGGTINDTGELLQVNGTAKITGATTIGGRVIAPTLVVGTSKTSGTGFLDISLSGGVSDTREIGYVFSSASTREVGSKISFIGSGNSGGNQGGYLTFSTSNAGDAAISERMRIDTSGNLGLGVTPSAWWSSAKAIQVGTTGSLWSGSGLTNVSHNYYFNGSQSFYLTNSHASAYQQTSGQHIWFNAPSGTAGNAITFTQAMTLTAAGRLILGAGDSGELLQVNGTAKITGATAINAALTITNGTGASFKINHSASGNAAGWFDTNEFGLLISSASTSVSHYLTNMTSGGTSRFRVNCDGSAIFSSSLSAASLSVSGTSTLSNTLILSGSTTSSYIGQISQTNTTAGVSFGLLVRGGTNSSDVAFRIQNAAANTNLLSVFGDGAATFSSSVTAGGNLLLTNGTAASIGAINLIRTGTSPVASRMTFGTDGTGYSFAIAKNQGGTITDLVTILDSGAATFSSSIQAATAIAIGTTPDTNKPFKILKNINATVGINFENTNTGATAFSAIQMGTDVAGGTKFTNLVYASSGISASGVYNPDGTSLINNGSGGLNFLGNPIRMYTGGSNGVLRWDLVNDGFITHYSATSPTTSATDGYRQYSADVSAGNAAPHFRTENGAVIKLYQETTAVGNSTISVGGGSAVLDDTQFGGYTLRQVVKALQNQGILA